MIGKYHSNITKNGLENYLNSDALEFTKSGNLDSDKVYRFTVFNITDGYNINAQHSNNASFDECEKFLKDAQSVVEDDFIEALNADGDNKNELYEQAFYDFGRTIHSIQDFYSHTNWINKTGGNVQIWNEDSENINLKDSENLKDTKYNQISQFIDKINPFYESYLEDNYDKMYNQKKSSISHFGINKDKPDSIASQLFEKEYNISGFELANMDAELHTKQKWEDVMTSLKKELSKEDFEQLEKEIAAFEAQDEYEEKYKDFRKNFNSDMKKLK